MRTVNFGMLLLQLIYSAADEAKDFQYGELACFSTQIRPDPSAKQHQAPIVFKVIHSTHFNLAIALASHRETDKPSLVAACHAG
jgi:hypothetical protein